MRTLVLERMNFEDDEDKHLNTVFLDTGLESNIPDFYNNMSSAVGILEVSKDGSIRVLYETPQGAIDDPVKNLPEFLSGGNFNKDGIWQEMIIHTDRTKVTEIEKLPLDPTETFEKSLKEIMETFVSRIL